MVKKIVVILILLLSVELLGGLVLLSAFSSFPPPAGKKVVIYNNAGSQNILGRMLAGELELSTLERNWKIDGPTLESWQAKEALLFTPKKFSSLPHYLYQEMGATHPWTSYAYSSKIKGLSRNEKLLGQYLLGLAQEVNRGPQNAELVIEQNQATKFTPHRSGLVLEVREARKLIQTKLLESLKEQPKIRLPVKTSRPQIQLADLNNLGINTLVARGQSDFAGSPGNRIHNIKVGAARYNGLILKPGEEFSFNKYLGPVDGQHGFLPELVIKPEGTLPEFGGGLCQVSTTAFRAAFFGGLPITARKNHSYAVKYYEWIAPDLPRAVGLDATIYPGAQDLKFLNDTAGALLISTQIEGHKLYFDFYGTPDEREVVMDGPHPFDRRPSGAVKSKVRRTVIKDGEKQEITFNSNYVSPNLYPRIYEFPKPVEPQVQTNN